MAVVTSLAGDQFRLAPGTVALSLVLLMLPAPDGVASDWERLFDNGGVEVWSRPYSGSPLMEYRGERRLEAGLGEIMALLKDADYNRQWVFRSGGARIIAENGFAQAYVHGVVDAPWPMEDRDTVVRFDYRQDPDTKVIRVEIENFPDYIPAQPGLVRVPDFGGFWQLTPEPGGEVQVIYQVHGDPGGLVPNWLANYAAEVSVTRTLQNMPAAVERYRGQRMPEVLELDTP